MPKTFKPFADDTSAATIGGLTVENGTDRVTLSGSLDLAHDCQGLDQAKALRALLDGVIASLEAEKDLPEKAAASKPALVTRKRNPFA